MAARKKSSAKTRKRKNPFLSRKISKTWYVVLLLLVIFGAGYHYRNELAYYFSFKTDKTWQEDKRHHIRNTQVMESHPENVFGIDVSEYQGEINWSETDSVEDKFPIGFVFIRAT